MSATPTEPQTRGTDNPPSTRPGQALHKGEMFDLTIEEDRRRLAVAIKEAARAEGRREAVERLEPLGTELLAIAEAALLQDAVDRHTTNEAMTTWTRGLAGLTASESARPPEAQ